TARERIPWTTRLTARLYYGLMRRYALPNMPAQGADFLLLDRKVIHILNSIPEKHTSLLGMILWFGFRQAEVEYVKKARFSGTSKWTLQKKLKLLPDSLLSFSPLPLRLVAVLAGLAGFGTVALTAGLLTGLLAGCPVPGWLWLMPVILAVGCAQLL